MFRLYYGRYSGISLRVLILAYQKVTMRSVLEKKPGILVTSCRSTWRDAEKNKPCFSCLDQHNCGGVKSAMRCFIKHCVEKHQSTPHFVKKQFFTYNQKPNNMQLGTTVIKTSKQARDPT